MAAVTALPTSTTGLIGLWNGTKDGQTDGFIDFSDGSSNVNSPKQVPIQAIDMRHQQPQPSLEVNGYGFMSHKTSVTAEQFLAGDTSEGKAFLKDVYFKEVAELIKRVTGCQNVHPYTLRIRHQSLKSGEIGTSDISHAALPVAHVDRDLETAPAQLRDVMGDRAQELLTKHKRYAQINIWRPIGVPIQKWPLCFVDHSSVPDWSYDTHLARVFPRNDPRVALRGEKSYDSVLKHEPKYTYHYVSNLGVDEVLIFSSFDSDVTKVAPHGAFWDDSSAPDAPVRRSIEHHEKPGGGGSSELGTAALMIIKDNRYPKHVRKYARTGRVMFGKTQIHTSLDVGT